MREPFEWGLLSNQIMTRNGVYGVTLAMGLIGGAWIAYCNDVIISTKGCKTQDEARAECEDHFYDSVKVKSKSKVKCADEKIAQVAFVETVAKRS